MVLSLVSTLTNCGLAFDQPAMAGTRPITGSATVGVAPVVTFRSVSAGFNYTCAVRANDTLICWGRDEFGDGSPPSGSFNSVSSSHFHTCGILADETLACWGLNGHGEASPPAGRFTSVGTGVFYSCGLRADSALTCWGDDNDQAASPPPGAFKSVSAGWYHACAVQANDVLRCWGLNKDGEASPPSGAFRSVSAGYDYSCGVRANDALACWGYNIFGEASPPAGEFKSVSAGLYHTCAIRTDGKLACWGLDRDHQASPPSGTFTSVSAGGQHTCAVQTDGVMKCWGLNGDGEATVPYTTTILDSAPNPSFVDQAVTYTATVSPALAGGTVSFSADGTTIAGCAARPVEAGLASCRHVFDRAALYSIDAAYSGSSRHLASAAPALIQVTRAKFATDTVIFSSRNPSTPGQEVTYVAVVSPPPGGGTVAFSENGITIPSCATRPLAGGVASCAQVYDRAGSRSIVATYSGDVGALRSVSPTLTQDVNP